MQQKENLYQLNQKLNKALKKANTKIVEVKEKYKQKVSKKCYYCNNDLELSMNLTTTLDPVNVSQLDSSFYGRSSSKVYDDDQEDERMMEENNDGGKILDNLYIQENL